jgi:hypothetical protein
MGLTSLELWSKIQWLKTSVRKERCVIFLSGKEEFYKKTEYIYIYIYIYTYIYINVLSNVVLLKYTLNVCACEIQNGTI